MLFSVRQRSVTVVDEALELHRQSAIRALRRHRERQLRLRARHLAEWTRDAYPIAAVIGRCGCSSQTKRSPSHVGHADIPSTGEA